MFPPLLHCNRVTHFRRKKNNISLNQQVVLLTNVIVLIYRPC